ncbi:hypothetical protein EGW08_019988 [Elysia chlorotica]|uniref:UDENN domain-containing protein n=1 Tax=Elysia chlorotica TaxID=188477 RepID=A0A433SSX8_ELYCH|nr:hypothetical protein EGW08_019988 [Elysia chlorotica]
MSDNSKQSVRQLPPGKLENLKKRFEDGSAGESPPTRGEKQPPPPRPPVPLARMKSPERPKLPAGKKPPPPSPPRNRSGANRSSAAVAGCVDALCTSDSNGGPAKPQPPAKPQVPRKPSAVGDSSLNVIDNPVYGDAKQMDQAAVAVADLYSKVNKAGKNKNVSSDQEVANIHRREAVRKNSGERRKTLLSFDTEKNDASGSEGVSVAMRTKLFDVPNAGKPTPPRKSEAVRSMSMRTSREQKQITQKEVPQSSNGSEEIYDPPWDLTKSSAIEKFKQTHQPPVSAAEPPPNLANQNKIGKPGPPPLPSQPPPKTPWGKKNIPGGTNKPSPNNSPAKPPHIVSANKELPAKSSPSKPPHIFSANKDLPAKSSPPKPPHITPANRDSATKSLSAGPPPKPPRTHAHDHYLISKISKEPETQDQQAPKKPVTILETGVDAPGTSEETEYFSVKDRLAKLMQLQTPEASSSSPPSSSSPSSRETDVVFRQKPPSRPPPPKHRRSSGDSGGTPSSRASPPARPLTHCPETEHSHGGPIIIPVFPRGQQPQQQKQQLQPGQRQSPGYQYQRQNSATHDNRRRQPTDDLPQEPDGLRPLQRFPLRKSFSSECVHSSRGSSLNLSTAGTWGDSSAGMGDNYSDMSRSAHAYEAVIDPDGYAVPNEFLRVPHQKKHSHVGHQMIVASPDQFLTKLRGFEASSESGGKDETRGSKTPAGKQDITKVTKKKLIMVREKINQAYAALEVALRGQGDGDEDTWGSADMPAGSRPVSEELVVEATELQRRIEYCTSVRLKSTRSIKRSKEYCDVIYPQLFEYCLVVGLRLQDGGSGYEPYLIHKFPENHNSMEMIDKLGRSVDPKQLSPSSTLYHVGRIKVSSNLSVPSFCFPDASIFKPGSTTSVSESYSFVMTYADGSRVYGYCRRLQPPDCSLPEVICIISPIDAFNMYNTLLSEIEQRRRISSDLAHEVIAASFGRPLPKPGKVCHIRTLDNNGEMETIFLNRPTDNRLDDVNYESPLFYLGTDRLVKVFSSMLMERRIILCSSNLSILTQTVHALSALLYPFHWQHVYVPLLPLEMLDVVCAPMPYILGVLSAFLPQVLQMDTEQVFIVDLDKKSIVQCQGDESNILPRKVQRALKTAINMCKIDSDAQNAQWLMVAEAFLRMFIETIGHFTSHVRTQQDGNRIFQKEGFVLEMVSKELRQFLEWFTETQMFEVFIVDVVDKPDLWDTNDLFMQRLKEHRDSKEENNRSKGLGAKVKNFGKALKTKLQS